MRTEVGNWVGLLACSALVVAAMVYRIRIEERGLVVRGVVRAASRVRRYSAGCGQALPAGAVFVKPLPEVERLCAASAFCALLRARM